MEKINEIKIPKGIRRIAVKQHEDKIVIEFIPKEAKFKRGDILKSTVYPDLTVIFDKMASITTFDSIYHNMGGSNHDWRLDRFRHATKEENQEFFDELKADGKRWNAEKKCIEDTPKPKFKVGDAVRIKNGISSKTHRYIGAKFVDGMDELIGQKLMVNAIWKLTDRNYVYRVANSMYDISEDWLEPYVEELKNGDWAIFWDNDYRHLSIRLYHAKSKSGNSYCDNFGTPWDNAVKWDGTKEQFEKVLRGEI